MLTLQVVIEKTLDEIMLGKTDHEATAIVTFDLSILPLDDGKIYVDNRTLMNVSSGEVFPPANRIQFTLVSKEGEDLRGMGGALYKSVQDRMEELFSQFENNDDEAPED